MRRSLPSYGSGRRVYCSFRASRCWVCKTILQLKVDDVTGFYGSYTSYLVHGHDDRAVCATTKKALR